MENQTKPNFHFHYYADGIEVTQRIFNAIAMCNARHPEFTTPCLMCYEMRPPLTGNPHIEKAIREAFDNYDAMFPNKSAVVPGDPPNAE